MTHYVQQYQPEGVPPLELTGERTLPDVPDENYWYRRHLVVYEWIARHVSGRRVIDMASGEGYGTAILAREAAHVTGVEANPEAFEHAVAKYRSDNISFERALVETYTEPDAQAVVFLQTVEHLKDPDAVLEHFKEAVGPAGTVFISTPNVLTLAPKGAERSGNPWHITEYKSDEFRALCERHFSDVSMLGLFHSRKLRVHELAIKAGWDFLHPRLGVTKRFYDWFTPAIDQRDFRFSAVALNRALDFLAICRV